MKPFVNYQKVQTAYKKPNSNFPQELCAFISQSKHEKQEQIEEINQYMIEQFIHLFQICNINRYIDYTPEFIDEIRSIILRLQIVEKKQFQSFDEKDEFMYLVVQGKVQKVKRQKPITAKRVTRFNMTSLNFGTPNAFMSSFNSRPSHQNQTFYNIQLREFEKSVIMNRTSRMSMMSGNLWSQMVSSPRKKCRTQDKFSRTFGSFSAQNHRPDSPFKPRLNRFKEKIAEEEQNSGSDSGQKAQQTQKSQRLYNVELLQPLQNETYHCMTGVKYIKLLKWSYDQLVQYVFKYQNDRVIDFLSKTLLISQNQIKFHQIYNKTVFNYFQQRESRHSNEYIGLQQGSIYILRKGSVEFKYKCFSNGSLHSSNPKSQNSQNKNPNLAQYINHAQSSFKKIILNEGAIICPQLEKNQFFIQSLQSTVFIEISHKLADYLRDEIKNHWWIRKFLPYYKAINEQRELYMRDQQVSKKEVKNILKMENVCIQTKKRRLHSAKVQKTRFRCDPKSFNDKINSEKQVISQNVEENKENIHNEEFCSSEYKQFISILPYQIMVKSKEKISMKLNQKSKTKHISDKVFNYLKRNQKLNTSSKYKDKVLQLKMKNIAAKQMNVKDLNNIYEDINNNNAKKQFHKSLKGNWFKEQNNVVLNAKAQCLAKQSSQHSDGKCDDLIEERRAANASKSNTQIIALNKRFNDTKKKFSMNTMQSADLDEKKVTFAFNDLNTLNNDSSDEQYLCSDDTGLINKFVQNSHNYQKQINFLINSSQREDKYQNHKKKKLKTCKTEGNNLLFSHNLINDILKRVNKGATKTIISSHKSSKKPSNVNSKCPSEFNSETPLDQSNQKGKNQSDKLSVQKNDSNLFSQILEQMKSKKTQISDEKHTIDFESCKQKDLIEEKLINFKDKKTTSFTNYSSSKSSSCKFLKSNNRCQNVPLSYNRKTFTESKEKDSKGPYVQSSFFQQKSKRPMTALNMAPRQQCKSLMFNQWIETEPGSNYKDERNSELGVATYNFCQRNISTGDKKIWKRLKSGKIVKKSVKFYNNQGNTSLWGQKSIQMV